MMENTPQTQRGKRRKIDIYFFLCDFVLKPPDVYFKKGLSRGRPKQCFCLVFVLFFVLFLLVWVVLVVVLVLLGVVLVIVEVVASHYRYYDRKKARKAPNAPNAGNALRDQTGGFQTCGGVPGEDFDP